MNRIVLRRCVVTIFYQYKDKLYLNITNRCSNNCIFCTRQRGTLGNVDSLWLEHEPSLEEIISAYEKLEQKDFSEAVFCGYGEPLERLDIVLEVCKYLREVGWMKIRINTNGLADLINGKATAHLLKGLVDAVSISLNASDAGEYVRICRPRFGEIAFEAMLKFAADCQKYVPDVLFTVVDIVSEEEISSCRRLAGEMGIPLRVRKYAAI